jgi:hypothetical protein
MPLDDFDRVGLRLQTYLLPHDPLLNDKSLMSAVADFKREIQERRTATACANLANLLSANVAIDDALNIAIGIQDNEQALRVTNMDTMHWVMEHNFCTASVNEYFIRAMCSRGLVVHESGECLTCKHHATPPQLWDAAAALFHFTEKKSFHRHQQPSIATLAHELETENVHGGIHIHGLHSTDAILSIYTKGAQLLRSQKQGSWSSGSLGRAGTGIVAPLTVSQVLGAQSPCDEMYQTLATTRKYHLEHVDLQVL